jgi:prolyl 4-hydroxylase
MDFIRTYEMNDKSICDRLIDRFENDESKYVGITIDKFGIPNIDKEYKDSMNINFSPNCIEPIFLEYQKELQKALLQYIDEFQYCNEGGPWTILEPVTIQKYEPNGGFKAWHFERMNAVFPSATRHIVFLTYLNDVNDQGGTEFFYYPNRTLQARKGVTAIWPSDWTHTHRGITSPTEKKYIMAGWLNFYVPKVV